MTTMAIVLITVFFLGGTTEMTLNYLQINTGVDEETYMRSSLREPVVSSAITNFGEWKAYTSFLNYVSLCSASPSNTRIALPNPEDNNYIRPFVIRDFTIMNGIDYEDEDSAATDGRSRRPCTPLDPTIEMTESGHFNNVGHGTGIQKLVRTSLFDYGAN
jgi:hypothetical protein